MNIKTHVPVTKTEANKTGISRNLETQKQSQSVEIFLTNQKQNEGTEIAG